MVPVSRLPDLCLLALFRQMTLQDQINARKVCRRWDDLVPEATLKRRQLTLLLGNGSIKKFKERIDCALFHERQAQKLLLNADGTKMYSTRRLTSWNSLQVKSLDEASTEQIASTFTKTKELQVTVLNISLSSLDNLVHLLEQWSRQLVSLQLFESSWNIDNPTTTRLFAAINSLSVLKKLHLDLNNMSVPDLSIVSQLEELRFNSYATTREQFAQWLQQYGELNQSLARIDYVAEKDDEDDSTVLDQFFRLSEPLRRCFTHFDAAPIRDPARICSQFSGLTTLTLYLSHITPRQLFTPLATLHQLIHLSLVINFESFSVDNLEHDYLMLLPQVKSVKALELTIFGSTPVHQQLAQLKLPWTLPNVEVIHFQLYFHCTECPIDTFWLPSEQAKSCLGQLFTPLKRDCTKLRLIQYKKDIYGTVEELLVEPTSEH